MAAEIRQPGSAPTSSADAFEQALLVLDRLAARRLLTELEGGESVIQRIETIMVPALERIGLAWERGSIALSQVYMSGRICEDLVDGLLQESGRPRKDQHKMAVAVLEDYHLLGKRMVYSTLRASGFALKDYGRMEAEALARQAVEDEVELLLISTLMLPSALRVEKVKDLLDRSGSRAAVIVGGAPFRIDPQLGREVGADAVGKSAADAVAIVQRLAGGAS
jgi:methanogenic corrinoid protein MtbC1